MAYTPPNSDEADFNFSTAYTPPNSDAADMDIGAGDTVEVSAPAFEQTSVLSADAEVGLFVVALPFIQTSLLSAEVSGFNIDDTIIRYFFTITGAEDGEIDVDLPMKSFQSRRRSGDPTYLQVVIPSVAYIDYLTDRPNGKMVISQGYERDGEILQREPIIETDVESVDVYEGGENNSIVLIGYTTTIYASKSVLLIGLTYKSTIDGKNRYRLAKPNIFLNPGDEVTIGDATFTAGVISYSISAIQQQIEVEAA